MCRARFECRRLKSCRASARFRTSRTSMKLSIEAELVYNFVDETQVVANLEASRTSDQIILSETLDIQPPSTILSDTTPHGDRRIRASLSGDVTIRYSAVVETIGDNCFRNQVGSTCGQTCQVKFCRFCCPVA